MRLEGGGRAGPVSALHCRRYCPRDTPSPRHLEVIGGFKSTHRVCQLVSLSHQNVLMLQPSPWGGNSSIVPSWQGGELQLQVGMRGGLRATRGWWQGAKAQGAGLPPVRVCEALLGSLPARTQRWEELECYSRTGRARPWVQAPLGLARGPSSTAGKQSKAMTPRVGLCESQDPLGGNESRQVGLGAGWQEPSVPQVRAGLCLGGGCTYRWLMSTDGSRG